MTEAAKYEDIVFFVPRLMTKLGETKSTKKVVYPGTLRARLVKEGFDLLKHITDGSDEYEFQEEDLVNFTTRVKQARYHGHLDGYDRYDEYDSKWITITHKDAAIAVSAVHKSLRKPEA